MHLSFACCHSVLSNGNEVYFLLVSVHELGSEDELVWIYVPALFKEQEIETMHGPKAWCIIDGY